MSAAREEASHSRARARGNRDAGVKAIVGMMARGEWRTGKSHLALCAEYGIGHDAAREWAGEAARQLRAMAEHDREALRELFAARFARYEEMAEESGDARTAVAAVAEQAKLLGLVVQRQEVALKTETMTDEEIAARLKALGYERKEEP